MRGEQRINIVIDLVECGSSPHAWGTDCSVLSVQLVNRFIPTCVGNRTGAALWEEQETVHPHMRGEQPCNPDKYS